MIKRMHVAVNCSDLEKSLEFYRAFFGTEPTKVKDNYAKFELDDPALHFSLNVRPFEKGGVLNHLGFQVNDTEEVLAIGERLRQSELLLIDEMNTTCCYAVQDKVWVYDPDGNAWEIFYTKEDSEFESAGEARDLSLCCAPPSEPVKIELTSFRKKEKEQPMTKHYQNLVDDRIFFGGASDVEDMIKNEGVELIVDLRAEATECAYPVPHVMWIQVPLGDNAEQPQDQLLQQAIHHVVEAYAGGKKVGFHCAGGGGRAGSVAIGTLMKLGKYKTIDEAEAAAKAIRPKVNIKPAQREALETLFGNQP